MKFKAEFSMDNAAFEFPHEGYEVRQILNHIIASHGFGMRMGVIRDSNGNEVGSWRVEK